MNMIFTELRRLFSRYRLQWLVCVLLPLGIGGYYYLFYNQGAYISSLFSRWIPAAAHTPLSRFMCCWGCDWLWAFALTMALYLVYEKPAQYLRRCVLPAGGLGIALELLQLIQVPFLRCGTFDPLDIFTEITAVTSSMILIFLDRKYIHKKKRAAQ